MNLVARSHADGSPLLAPLLAQLQEHCEALAVGMADGPEKSLWLALAAATRPGSVDEVLAGLDAQGYGGLKAAVADAVIAFTEPFATRTRELLDDPGELDRILAAGAERANAVADATLQTAYDRVGFLSPLAHD